MYKQRNHQQAILLLCSLLAALGLAWVLRTPGYTVPAAGGDSAPLHPLPDCQEPVCVYFTNRDLAYGNGPEGPLIHAIDAARASIDVAAYDLDIWGLRDALLSADRRGVQVRLVGEADTASESEMETLRSAGIPLQLDRPDGLMHDKFVVIDRRQVWTGSMNFTINGAYRNDNNLMAFDSPALAALYLAEFEEMFLDRLFGAYSPTGMAGEAFAGKIPLQVYFSPDDGVQAAIVERILEAEQSVFFMAFSFTSDEIGDAMLDRHRAGVEVAGVFDESQYRSNKGTEFDRLLAAGMDVRIDGNPDKLHHKVIILDGQTVIAGSYNFSSSAETRNDENLLIIEDEEIAGLFLTEFRRVFALGHP